MQLFHWQKIETQIPDRGRHAATANIHKNYIYLLGGHTEYGDTSDFFRFNITSKQWEKLPSYEVTIYYHASVIYDDHLYVHGGYCNTLTSLDKMYKFDLHRLKWSKVLQKGSIPSPRYGHSMVLYKKKHLLLVFGGALSSVVEKNPFFEFDLITETWREIKDSIHQPKSPYFHYATINGETMYVLSTDYLYAYDIPFKIWKCLSINLPIRSYSRIEYLNGNLYVTGKNMNSDTLQRYSIKFYKFDLSKNEWHQIDYTGGRPVAREIHCSLIVQGYLYILGGRSTIDLDDVWRIKIGECSPETNFITLEKNLRKGYFVDVIIKY